MCEACAGIIHRLSQLERRVESAAHWPAWFADIQSGLQEIAAICEQLGVTLEQFYLPPDEHNNQPNPVRDAVIHELVRRGWTATRIGVVARMSERSVRRAMGRCPARGTATEKPVASVPPAPNVGADE